MSDVSVIGLGPMGLALARTLLGGGHRVTVWNRTAAKAAAVREQGAQLAASAAEAVAASPVVLVCVADYAASRAVLESREAATALKGRVLVQLSTGTPQDAREGEAWARARGADYLDGAILATPAQMGRPTTTLLLSGSETAYRSSEAVLRSTAGNLTYMGSAVGAAAAWDLATLSCLFGAVFGFVHGARICEVEGLQVGAFGDMVASIAPVIGEMLKQVGDDIQSETYREPEASMRTCAASGDLFVKQAREARIDATFPGFAAGLFGRAMAAGHADERLAALMKVLRAQPR